MDNGSFLLRKCIEEISDRVVALQRDLLNGQAEQTKMQESADNRFEVVCHGIFDILDLFKNADPQTSEPSALFLRKADKRLRRLLARVGVTSIEIRDLIEPGKSKVVATSDVDGKDSGAVLEVCREGYICGEKVMRVAEVVTVK